MFTQSIVLNQLVNNTEYFSKVLPHLKSTYFDSEPSRIVFSIIDKFAQEYSSKPTPEVIAIEANRMKIPEGVWDGVVDLIGVVESPISGQNYDWLLDSTETWMRDRAAHHVIMESVDIYSNPKRRGELGLIPAMMEEALVVGFDDDLGEVYWEMAAQHYDEIHSDKARIPFAVDILNKVTKGGPWRKTLNGINAGINVGKTTALVSLAADYAAMGYNVYYFTFEVSQSVIRHRMDCAILGLDFDTLEAKTRHEYVATIEAKARMETYGEIFIKEFPSGGAHTGHCRAYIKEIMKRRPNAKPDIIMFDYLGEMASERLPASMMSSSNTYYGSIARECRALAFEFDVVAWTALQFQRSEQNTKDMKMEGQADSINIPKILDFQLGLSVPDEYASLDQAWASIMKSRYSNKSKMKNFIIGLNNDKQKMYDVDPKLQTFSTGELNQSPLPSQDKVDSVPGAPDTGIRRIKRGELSSAKIIT